MSGDLFYIFCDETYPRARSGVRRIVTGYFAVPQDLWNRMTPGSRALRIPHNVSRMERIEKILDSTLGVAAITYADIDLALLPNKEQERNGTNDVPNMSRSDNFWGAAMSYGLAATLGYMGRNNLAVQNVDIYYDTHSLTQKHQSALEGVVTQTLPEIVRQRRRQRRVPQRFRCKVRRFNPVSKAATGMAPNKFQAGVLVADYLLRQAESIIKTGGRDRIYLRDNTKEVKRYILNFLA